jgi:hypothetical protein
MLEPGGRGDPLAPFKGIVVRVLGILAALVLFLSIVTVPLKGFDTDLNNASMSSSKAVSLDKVRASLLTEEVITPMSPTPVCRHAVEQSQFPLSGSWPAV